MSAIPSDAQKATANVLVVAHDDSFLPNYQELTFILRQQSLRPVRVVRSSDPRLSNLVCSTTGFRSAEANDETLQALNDKYHANENVTWWDAILLQGRQDKAQREGDAVKNRFGDVSRVDTATEQHLARLINDDAIDIVTFESVAGTPDSNNVRPSVARIRQRRAEKEQEARAQIEEAHLERRRAQRQRLEAIVAADRAARAQSTMPAEPTDVTEDRGDPSPPPEQAESVETPTPSDSGGSESSLWDPTIVVARYISGWANLRWAYTTNTMVDTRLLKEGIWLFDRPSRFRLHGQQILSGSTIRPGFPVVLAADSVLEIPMPSFHTRGHTLFLQPHHPPYQRDTRSAWYHAGASHPDFQPATALAQYQSLEMLGASIWRHDRDLLPCSGPLCSRVLSDMAVSTLICHGCGPCSKVRYCSVECKLTDLYGHGEQCGDPALLIPTIIDPATIPPRFTHLAPMIRDRSGLHTHARYRQCVHAQLSM
ncbi:MAG: hypothetical protein Q9183_004787, partial [Haloplaca sp. 2 TL-2023]